MATTHATPVPSGRLSADHLAGALARAAHRLGDTLAGVEGRLALRRLERAERRLDRDPGLPGLGALAVAARTGRTGRSGSGVAAPRAPRA